MIAFPEMLVPAAKAAGMKVPENLNKNRNKFSAKKYPHFQVFCNIQLGQALPEWTSHWTNAEVIAKIPDNEITKVTINDLIAKGLQVRFN